MMKILRNLIKLLIAFAILTYLIKHSLLNINLLYNILEKPYFIFPTVLLYVAVIALSALRWRLINKQLNININYYDTLLPTYLGISFNNLLPGGISGDLYRYFYINKSGSLRRQHVMISIFSDRLIGLLGIFFLLTLLTPFNISIINQSHVSLLSSYLSIFVSFSFILFMLLIYSPLSRLIKPILSKISHDKTQTLLTLISSPNKIILSIAISVFIQYLIAATCFMLAYTMNYPEAKISIYCFSVSFTQIANLLPLTPGGFGIGEMAFAKTMKLFTNNLQLAYATIFIAYRLIGILLYLPSIIIVLACHRQKNHISPAIETASQLS